MREGIVFYRSFFEALKGLPADVFQRMTVAILEYGLDGKEPDLSGLERSLFEVIKPQIDANNQRYENGKKGGRPKTKEEPNNNQTKPNKTDPEPKEKEKDKVKEKVKVKDKEKGKDKEKVKDNICSLVPSLSDLLEHIATNDIANADANTASRFLEEQNANGWTCNGVDIRNNWRLYFETYCKINNKRATA